MRSLWLLPIASVLFSCAVSPKPTRRSADRPADAVELFRRARFSELIKTPGGTAMISGARMRPVWMPEGEDVADWSARTAYRKGDARGAAEALNGLSAASHTRLLLSALLANVNHAQPLRHTVSDVDFVELPLRPEALALGMPVIDIEIKGRRFGMLWDTGATENVLSPYAANELDLIESDARFPVLRADDGYVVRFAAVGTDEVEIGDWRVRNVPWLVAPLADLKTEVTETIDNLHGFISPQLMVPEGCFAIDRARGRLRVGLRMRRCRKMLADVADRSPVYRWNGEIYAGAQVHQSPELAVQLETGSAVTYLRADAARYLPWGAITPTPVDARSKEAIAHELTSRINLRVAGQGVPLGTIDLSPTRATLTGHDDIATLGMDVMLQGTGVVVSFATMEMGFLPSHAGSVATR